MKTTTRTLKPVIGAVLSTFVTVMGGGLGCTATEPPPPAGKGVVSPPAEPVFVAIKAAHKQTLVTLTAEVVVSSDASYQAAPPIEGIVVSWNVKVGDRVTKGAPLAQMASPILADMDAQADAMAGVLRAQSRLVRLRKAQQKAGFATAPEVAEAQVGAAQSRAQRTTLRRQKKVREALGISGPSWTWSSPVAGVVTEVLCAAGSTVGNSPCLRIVDSSAAQLRVAVPERYGTVVDGVTVDFVAASGARSKGLTMKRAASAIEPQSRTRAFFFDPGNSLVGTSGRANVIIAAPPGLWSVPTSAITSWEGGDAVFVRGAKDTTPEPVAVEVVGRHSGQALVRSKGFAADTQVASTQVFTLKSRRLLNPDDEAADAPTEKAP